MTVTVTTSGREQALRGMEGAGFRQDQYQGMGGGGEGRCSGTMGSEVIPEDVLKEIGRSQLTHQECWERQGEMGDGRAISS